MFWVVSMPMKHGQYGAFEGDQGMGQGLGWSGVGGQGRYEDLRLCKAFEREAAEKAVKTSSMCAPKLQRPTAKLYIAQMHCHGHDSMPSKVCQE